MSGIDRRQFVRNVLAAGAVTALSAACAKQEGEHGAQGGAAATGTPTRASTGTDTLVVNGLDPSALRAEYLDLLVAGGVHCWHRSAGGLQDLANMLSFCDQHADRIGLAHTVTDIRRLHGEGRIALLNGWQQADVLIQDGGDGAPAIGNLRAYRDLGLGICSITYNTVNAFGGGALRPDVGLTDAGRQLVEEIHKQKLILDIGGHTNEKTSFQALEISRGVPVICSHTNVLALTDNPRCSSDRMLEAIAATGGVIGVTAFNDFHARTRQDAHVPRTPQVELDKHLDQYDYLKKLVGIDHIGLGPDFVEGRNRPGIIGDHNRDKMTPEAYSQDVPWFYVKGFENIGELPNVSRGLAERGWTPEELRKLMGENWLRVYAQVWGA